jgi:hypothetical protein
LSTDLYVYVDHLQVVLYGMYCGKMIRDAKRLAATWGSKATGIRRGARRKEWMSLSLRLMRGSPSSNSSDYSVLPLAKTYRNMVADI